MGTFWEQRWESSAQFFWQKSRGSVKYREHWVSPLEWSQRCLFLQLGRSLQALIRMRWWAVILYFTLHTVLEVDIPVTSQWGLKRVFFCQADKALALLLTHEGWREIHTACPHFHYKVAANGWRAQTVESGGEGWNLTYAIKILVVLGTHCLESSCTRFPLRRM